MPLKAGRRPALVAHRAGNDPALLGAAAAAGADFVEADVWLYNGVLEVRHEKTMGSIPLRWDRWKLERRGPPRLTLPALLETMPPGLGLMLDLKGRDRRLPHAVLRVLDRSGFAGQVIASARRPELLDAIGGAGIPTFPSVGSEADLRRLERRSARAHRAGTGMHRKLMTPARLRRLRAIGACTLSWPVNDLESARRLEELGVDGFIIDRLDVLRALAARRHERQ